MVTRRQRSSELPHLEKRQDVTFGDEGNGTGATPGALRSQTTSFGSVRTSSLRHSSALEASRHRLSIRKSAAFPMQQTAPKAFLASCADITRHGRDWNAEFQLAWEMEDNTLEQATSRQRAIAQVEKEFAAEAARTVKQIVMLDDDGPRELPKFSRCYRVDNIFFRVLPDSRSGRNYVASLRGVLQSRSRLLAVPLSCMFFYRGMPVLAQALVPMPRQPTRLYGADSSNDKEVEAEILRIAEALNVPLPSRVVCSVYDGLDGRYYCTLTNAFTTPVWDGGTVVNCPVKRQEMLMYCPFVTRGPDDVLALLGASPLLDALCQLNGVSQHTVQERLCDILHFYGINFCFLKEVLTFFVKFRGENLRAAMELETSVVLEMMVRTIKEEFYLRLQSNQIASDDKAMRNAILSHLADCLDEVRFKRIFLPVLMRKYGVAAEDKRIIEISDSVRVSKRNDIIFRFFFFVGARFPYKAESNAERILWRPKVQASCVPALIDPSAVISLAHHYDITKTTARHTCAFCLPLQSRAAIWEGNVDKAMQYARYVTEQVRVRHGESSFFYLYALRDRCELLFAGNSVGFLSEGCALLEELLKACCKEASALTQMRRYVESACWLLNAAETDKIKLQALHLFLAAVHVAPEKLCSDFGAWLYIRPFLGILRCKQAMRPRFFVDVTSLAREAEKLAVILSPADRVVEYLWELGMELFHDKSQEAASRTLHTALNMGRKLRRSQLDLDALSRDVISVCRERDPARYGAYCDKLLANFSEKS